MRRRSASDWLCALQLEDFKLEETSQLLWSLATLRVPGDSAGSVFEAALAHWPEQLRASIASQPAAAAGAAVIPAATPPPLRAHFSPKNVVQLAFAYAKTHADYVPESLREEGAAGEHVTLAFRSVLAQVRTPHPCAPRTRPLHAWTRTRRPRCAATIRRAASCGYSRL
jgi:hypothetical protein